MKTTGLEKDIRHVPTSELSGIIDEYFSGRNPYLLREDTRRVFLQRYGEVGPISPAWWEGCMTCTVFDQDCEIRVEKAPFSSQGDVQILREQNSTEEPNRYFVRETGYLLRKTSAVVDPQHADGKSVLRYSEYFSVDNDGMLVREAGRLTGITREGK